MWEERNKNIEAAVRARTFEKLRLIDQIDDLDDPRQQDLSPMEQEEWMEVSCKDF